MIWLPKAARQWPWQIRELMAVTSESHSATADSSVADAELGSLTGSGSGPSEFRSDASVQAQAVVEGTCVEAAQRRVLFGTFSRASIIRNARRNEWTPSSADVSRITVECLALYPGGGGVMLAVERRNVGVRVVVAL